MLERNCAAGCVLYRKNQRNNLTRLPPTVCSASLMPFAPRSIKYGPSDGAESGRQGKTEVVARVTSWKLRQLHSHKCLGRDLACWQMKFHLGFRHFGSRDENALKLRPTKVRRHARRESVYVQLGSSIVSLYSFTGGKLISAREAIPLFRITMNCN